MNTYYETNPTDRYGNQFIPTIPVSYDRNMTIYVICYSVILLMMKHGILDSQGINESLISCVQIIVPILYFTYHNLEMNRKHLKLTFGAFFIADLAAGIASFIILNGISTIRFRTFLVCFSIGTFIGWLIISQVIAALILKLVVRREESKFKAIEKQRKRWEKRRGLEHEVSRKGVGDRVKRYKY